MNENDTSVSLSPGLIVSHIFWWTQGCVSGHAFQACRPEAKKMRL